MLSKLYSYFSCVQIYIMVYHLMVFNVPDQTKYTCYGVVISPFYSYPEHFRHLKLKIYIQ